MFVKHAEHLITKYFHMSITWLTSGVAMSANAYCTFKVEVTVIDIYNNCVVWDMWP